jgi:SMI1 / KNR4 family (SUKH-1)
MVYPVNDMDYQTQLQRIREKLLLAKQKDSRLEVFGAKNHRYQLGQPIKEQEVRAFETRYDLQLPEAYCAFVTHIGNGNPYSPQHHSTGGAGPYYGIYALGNIGVITTLSDSAKPCQLHPNITKEDWDERTEILEQENLSDEDYEKHRNALFQGLMCIGTQGCTYHTCLVVTGWYSKPFLLRQDSHWRMGGQHQRFNTQSDR